MGERFMKIEAQQLIRIALSPLTVRAVAGMGFKVSEVMEKYQKRTVETENTLCDENEGMNAMRVHLSIPGFVIRCFAEQPRVQLLRLVFRDVKCFLHFPASIGDEGKAELSVRDVILEDTVSPHLQEGDVRESRSRSSCTIVSSAQGNARVDERPLLLSEPGSVFDSSQLGNSSEHGRWEPKPVFYCFLSWYLPFEQVAAQIGGRGIDIAVNLGMLPTCAEWAETLVHEYAAVQRAQSHRHRSKTRSSMTATTPSFPLRIDHIVVEPLRIRISVSSPPRDLQPSWTQRMLSWMVSAENADGMVIDLPQVVFTGDFSSTQQFLGTFKSSYMRALLSRHMFKQIIRQAPRILRLGRVLATSWTRRRSRAGLITGKKISVEREGSVPSATRDIGLIGALTQVQYRLATHVREVHDVQTTEEGFEQVSPTQQASGEGQAIQTIDITDSSHHARTEDESQEGKSLFLWLRAHDHRIPRNERFENNFSFSPAVSMLTTSRYLLFVNRSIRAVQEPIIARANIAEYHITGPRITIVTVLSGSISPARFVARQRERDSPSLARYLRASPRISQIQMHEIECTSPQYASWLLQQLPPPNETLRSRLYRSR
ncbi:hypothetical protein FGB62_5g243 [Gracilaria domingensis]|nr:hypothetical protein FGB62_5g243 [Gracilaria domingensis]